MEHAIGNVICGGNMLLSKSFSRHRKGAFTLMEMMVVIMIIAVLAGLSFPAYTKINKSIKTIKCASNLRQIGVGILAYVADNDGKFPPGSDPSLGSWDVNIASYMGIKLSSSVLVNPPIAANLPTSILRCPADSRPLTASPRSYTASTCSTESATVAMGVFSRYSIPGRKMAVLPSPSLTIMIAEWPQASNFQFQLSYSVVNGWLGGSQNIHGVGQNYLFCDGHVECLTVDQILTRNGWQAHRWIAVSSQ
jgi:prepilin-type N-terminal cleavage/methylation domain-containing protein/prepilin-type processing-associated H-X9-DG protein